MQNCFCLKYKYSDYLWKDFPKKHQFSFIDIYLVDILIFCRIIAKQNDSSRKGIKLLLKAWSNGKKFILLLSKETK